MNNSNIIFKNKAFGDICNIGSSKRIYMSEYREEGIEFFRGKEIISKRIGREISEKLYISLEKYNELQNKFGVPEEGDILLTAVGTLGISYLVGNEKFYFKDGNIIWLKDFVVNGLNYYIYDYMQSKEFMNKLDSITIGSTQKALTIQSLNKMLIKIPDLESLNKYIEISKNINSKIKKNVRENVKISKMRDILLPKLMNGEIDVSNISLEE